MLARIAQALVLSRSIWWCKRKPCMVAVPISSGMVWSGPRARKLLSPPLRADGEELLAPASDSETLSGVFVDDLPVGNARRSAVPDPKDKLPEWQWIARRRLMSTVAGRTAGLVRRL